METSTEDAPICLDELRDLAGRRFGDMVKAVVDIRRRVVLLATRLVPR